MLKFNHKDKQLGRLLALRLTKVLAIDHAEKRDCTNYQINISDQAKNTQPISITQYLRRLCL